MTKRAKKSRQLAFLKTLFQYDQYWSIHYTEYNDLNISGKDYKTIIRSRSAELAKDILRKKVSEDNKGSKVKALRLFMLHKDSIINDLSLNLKDWSCIKKCSFPNEVNTIFRFEVCRPKGYTNRFNKMNQGSNPNNGFKKGHAKFSFPSYTMEEKSRMLWKRGKWHPWPESERQAFKQKIIFALKSNNNNRGKAANYLGIHVRYFQKLLKDKFIEVDWRKEYPPPIVLPKVDVEAVREGCRLRFEKNAKKKTPEIQKLLNEGLPIYLIAEKIKSSKVTVKKYISYGNLTRKN
jgi:hypothetical protein